MTILQFVRDVTVVVDHTQADAANPGVTPQQFAVDKQARYVRLTATRLATRKNDFILALAELEIRDSQGKNLAAGKPVVALDTIDAPPRWRRQNLVDGLAPQIVGRRGWRSSGPTPCPPRSIVGRRVPKPLRNELAEAKRLAKVTQGEMASLPPVQRVYAATVHYGNGAFRGTGPDGGRPRPIHVLKRGDVDQPLGEEAWRRQLEPAAVAAGHVRTSLGACRAAAPGSLGALAFVARESAHLAFDRQSRLAVPFRPWVGRHAERFRPDGASAQPS